MYDDPHDPTRWVLPAVLAEQARKHGDRRFVSIVDGESLTFAALDAQASRVAGMLADRGVAPGDKVGLMLPNGLDFLRAWCGITRLGAVAVLLNTDLSGAFLAHPLRDADPVLLILASAYVERVAALDWPSDTRLLIAGDGGSAGFDAWRDATPTSAPMPQPADIACIMYTSGTTGAPKGVLMPHAHCYLFGLGAIDNLGVTSDDRYYICLPLYHANGLLMQVAAALISGAQAVVRERFSASAWLDDIRRSGATITHTLGAISAFVIARPPSRDDRDHALRAILSAPNHPAHEHAWRERFGIADALGGYGMTEINIPLYGQRGISRPGTCGRPYTRYFEVEVRDPATDMPLAIGETGEIMVRPKIPGGFMAGYHGQPDKTVEATRNFWFHTGDAGRIEPDGYVTFVDRIKDCIRRRGENISAVAIEAGFADLAGVAEIAAFAVPASMDGGEDEIMLAIIAQNGVDIAPAIVRDHARQRLPRFAQPRYVEFVTALPRTGSEKVRKVELRKIGVTEHTIDLDLLDQPARS